MHMMRMMVVKGRACVDWWYQATVFTRLHMKKKGTAGEKILECASTLPSRLASKVHAVLHLKQNLSFSKGYLVASGSTPQLLLHSEQTEAGCVLQHTAYQQKGWL